MQVGDIVTLTGMIIKVAEDGNPMNNLVVFEHHADKTDRFIEYWFSDVFLEKPKTKRAYCETCQAFIDADTGEREK